MGPSRATVTVAKLTDNDPHTVGRGWVLDGAGPARYGWYRRAVTGRQYWIGRTVAGIRAALASGDASPIR